jgi:hypothetical protein
MSDSPHPANDDLQAKLDLHRADLASLNEPEFRALCDELAQSSDGRRLLAQHERFERALRVAMHDVPVLRELAVRVIAGIEAASLAGTAGLMRTEPVPSATDDARQSRRRWLRGGIAAAVALAASLAIVAIWPSQRVLVEADLQESHTWHVGISENGWRSMSREDLSEHGLPRELRLVPARFRDASDVVRRDATAYDVTAPGGPKATLFVIQQEQPIDKAPFFAPQVPQHRTQGYSVAYWQDNDHVYVVVIETDDAGDYRRLIDTSSGAPFA